MLDSPQNPFSSDNFISTLLGVVFGFLSSFAIFRARFVAIEKDVSNLEKTFKRELENFQTNATAEWARIRDDVRRTCEGDSEFRRRQERREIAMLELLTDISRHLRVSRRAGDLGVYDEPPDVTQP